MKRTGAWLLGLAVLAAVALAIWKPWSAGKGALDQLTWGEVTRGDLEVAVSSTGTLEALDSVEVGTQVSGTLTEIHADFNDAVGKGQILAVIDTSLLDSALRDAEAGRSRAQAQYDQAVADLGARRELHTQGVVSQSELRTYETALVAARSSLDSAAAQVERARQNRDNAVIRSPIDGIVVERAVEVGQTVAASFSTPRLFLLARDLARMRILAEVDEGDIGQIRLDQEVTFQVAAQPDREFRGQVRQIRLQPKVDQNVVKYTVVVDAENPEGLLLPGMTATLAFVVERSEDVLTVPVAATRVRPNAAMTALLEAGGARPAEGAAPERSRAARAAAAGAGGRSGSAGGGARASGVGEPRDTAAPRARSIYVRDEAGRLAARQVRLGLSDGRRIEIQPLDGEIAAGTPVVVGAPADGAANSAPVPGARGATRGIRPL
jgi:HlyD family secretion protein